MRLLDNVLEYAREPQRSVWVREVLALLYPLARRSRMVARLLVRAAARLGIFSAQDSRLAPIFCCVSTVCCPMPDWHRVLSSPSNCDGRRCASSVMCMSLCESTVAVDC